MHLHSEVLRYSSSASTIRPLFEYIQFYDDIRICVYDITCKSITTSNLKCNVNVTVVTINIYVGTRLKPCTGSKLLANMQPDLPLHGVTTRVMTTDSSSYKSISTLSAFRTRCFLASISSSELILPRSYLVTSIFKTRDGAREMEAAWPVVRKLHLWFDSFGIGYD